MRKLALVFLASAALLGGACGGSGSDSKNADANVNAGASVNSKTAGAAAAAAAAKVCDGREAVSFAATAASAMAGTANKDFKAMANALRTAGAAAPSEIKADFTLIVTTEAAYLDLLASSNGNYMQLAQNPQFQSMAQKMAATDFKAAADHVNAYFAQHCQG